MAFKKFFLVAVAVLCSCQVQSKPDSPPKAVTHVQKVTSGVKRFELGYGSIELPSACTVTSEFDTDAWCGNINCPDQGWNFYHEGGFIMPLVMKSDRKAWHEFRTEKLPDGNTLRYGISKVKEVTHCYASICLPEQEFGCGSFQLKTKDVKLISVFLALVRTYQLRPLSDLLKKDTQT